VESDVTREISPPEPEENEPIQITRQVPDPTATAEPTPVPEPTPVQIETSSSPVQGNVTFNGYLTEDVASFDPQIAQDPTGINYVENLFVSLTKYDLVTAEVLPEAATSWDISQDGLEYSFYLRTDIPWVYHNPVSGETIQAIDGDGRPRFVTAHDFAYSIRRACDPNIATYFNRVIAPVIVGCEEVLNAVDPGNISEEAIAAIGVEALDEATLVIQLNYPAAHFLSMTPMSTLAASPEWTIIKYGRIWTEAGTIVTSGPYVLHEWIHSNRIILLRNPFMPEDMQGTGNIDRHVVTILPDVETGYSLWQNHEVDISSLPDSELYTHPAQFPDETLRVPDLAVFYISFRMTKPPFDNVHVRRAFSAAFDREMFINETRNGLGLPMRHFAPPGIFGAPHAAQIIIGFNLFGEAWVIGEVFTGILQYETAV
jgi:oligopeptide transport system substrate-binding protein